MYRINTAIDVQLEDPQRIRRVKQQLKIGQDVRYFDRTSNREEEAILLEIKKTRVKLRHKMTGKNWVLPIYWLNIERGYRCGTGASKDCC